MNNLELIIDSEYQRGQRAAANWWRVSDTTTAVARQRHDQIDADAHEAFVSRDAVRFSYLLGMVDYFDDRLQ